MAGSQAYPSAELPPLSQILSGTGRIGKEKAKKAMIITEEELNQDLEETSRWNRGTLATINHDLPNVNDVDANQSIEESDL
jgi:hypothetical protein